MFTRRQALQGMGGFLGASMSGWIDRLALGAEGTAQRTKSCILLWMDGGPSHKDTWDLKPGTTDGGEFGAINTSVPGIQICEQFPKLARQMQHMAILRSMSTPEREHARASYHVHTGYRMRNGGFIYPCLGAHVAKELGRTAAPVPQFVAINGVTTNVRFRGMTAGFLGPEYQPLRILEPARGVSNVQPTVGMSEFAQQFSLLQDLERGFYQTHSVPAAQAHTTMLNRAARMMSAGELQAFDINREPESARSAFGTHTFGQACLLARRLVEVGVPFIEIGLSGWDTHGQNFPTLRRLCPQVDDGMSALMQSLHERGLLDSTLLVWMGEMGRTPHLKTGNGGGRDHYSAAWSTVLAGAGIRTGQVIGRTDGEGAAVLERPIAVGDFLATICRALGINHRKQNEAPGSRPIRIVDQGEHIISELF